MLEATDVNDDGLTTALDALTVINHLNSGAEGKLSLDAVSTGAKLDFTDVNNDGTVSPLDALLVINQLNQLSQGTSPTEDAATRSSVTWARHPRAKCPTRSTSSPRTLTNRIVGEPVNEWRPLHISRYALASGPRPSDFGDSRTPARAG